MRPFGPSGRDRLRATAGFPGRAGNIISFLDPAETARKHYPQTTLVTDEEGADLLVERLGLEFKHVSTELPALAAAAADGSRPSFRTETGVTLKSPRQLVAASA
jgi:hypothetical protein